MNVLATAEPALPGPVPPPAGPGPAERLARGAELGVASWPMPVHAAQAQR